MSTTLRVAVILGASAAAFVAGRAWPGAPARSPQARGLPTPPATPLVGPADDARADRDEARPPAGPGATAAVPHQDDLTVTPFIAAWRDDPDAAEATKTAVIAALEARRRQVDADVRACAPLTNALLRVRLPVAVISTAELLVIGDPQPGEVLEGPPLDDAALACVAEVLRGRDEVAATTERRPFLAAYEGVVDYTMAIAYGP